MFNPMDLTGKNIIVTGASSGIGKATAIYLSRLGAHVAVVARTEEKLKDTIASMDGEDHRLYIYDFSETTGIEQLVRTIVKDFGPISGLAYCAGAGSMRPLKVLSADYMEKVMTLHFYSFIEIMRILAKKGNTAPSASVVSLSSIASRVGSKSKIAYCAAKASLDAATRCLAKELADKNIRVNTIQPSWVNTPILEDYKEKWADSAYAGSSFDRLCLGVTEPEEIAGMIAFLMSDIGKTITGTAILIDSGNLA